MSSTKEQRSTSCSTLFDLFVFKESRSNLIAWRDHANGAADCKLDNSLINSLSTKWHEQNMKRWHTVPGLQLWQRLWQAWSNMSNRPLQKNDMHCCTPVSPVIFFNWSICHWNSHAIWSKFHNHMTSLRTMACPPTRQFSINRLKKPTYFQQTSKFQTSDITVTYCHVCFCVYMIYIYLYNIYMIHAKSQGKLTVARLASVSGVCSWADGPDKLRMFPVFHPVFHCLMFFGCSLAVFPWSWKIVLSRSISYPIVRPSRVGTWYSCVNMSQLSRHTSRTQQLNDTVHRVNVGHWVIGQQIINSTGKQISWRYLFIRSQSWSKLIKADQSWSNEMRSDEIDPSQGNFTSTGWFWPFWPSSPIFDVINCGHEHVTVTCHQNVGRSAMPQCRPRGRGVSGHASVPAVTACLRSWCFAVGALCSLSLSHGNTVQWSSTKMTKWSSYTLQIYIYIW